jgi:predicted metalloprotease with PDZ domain
MSKLPLIVPFLLLNSLPAQTRVEQPVVNYTISIDSSDYSGFRVEMRIRHAPDTLLLAFARHPEYDEQFWKNLRDLTVESGSVMAPLVREDSALWRVTVRGGLATVRYRFELRKQSSPTRRSWRIFLRETGGLIGGPQTFLYIVRHANIPAYVTLAIPSGWNIATGLESTADPRRYFASSVDELVDSPILVGTLRTWSFVVDTVPHRVVYWSLPRATPFDTAAVVDCIERIVRAAVTIFGRLPYRAYAFLLQDGAGDALEHLNSLTLGAPSAMLAHDPGSINDQLAHEYFHTWNLVRIRPKEQTSVTYKPPTSTPALWWSEGVTLYYANILLRRAGLLDSAAMRRHLADNIASFYQNPGNARISPEQSSMRSIEPVTSDSGYTGSYYTQGMLFGQLLDIAIRDSTDMRRGLDDVMLAMFNKFPRATGFTSLDLEQAAAEVCGCDLHHFFNDYIRGTRPLDIDSFLRNIGLHAVISRAPAVDSTGHVLPDLRVFGYVPEDDRHIRLVIFSTPNAWWLAGLRTGDDILAINGREIGSAGEFRDVLAQQTVGDTLVVDYLRAGQRGHARVPLTAYEKVRVELHQLPELTTRQHEMLLRWTAGTL